MKRTITIELYEKSYISVRSDTDRWTDIGRMDKNTLSQRLTESTNNFLEALEGVSPAEGIEANIRYTEEYGLSERLRADEPTFNAEVELNK